MRNFELSSDVLSLEMWTIARDLHADDECMQKNAFLTVEKSGMIDYDSALKNSGYNPAVRYINLPACIDGEKLLFAIENTLDIDDLITLMNNEESSEGISELINDIERAILDYCQLTDGFYLMTIADYMSGCGERTDSEILAIEGITEKATEKELVEKAEQVLLALDSHIALVEDSVCEIVEYYRGILEDVRLECE